MANATQYVRDLLNKIGVTRSDLLKPQPVKTFVIKKVNQAVNTAVPKIQNYFQTNAPRAVDVVKTNLGNVDKGVVWIKNVANQAKTNWNMPQSQRADIYRNTLANQLQNDYLTKNPAWVSKVQDFTRNLPQMTESRYQQATANLSPLQKRLLIPTHITNQAMSYVPGVITGMLWRSPEETVRIENIKKNGTIAEKATLMKQLQMEQATSIAFGATSAPVEGRITPELARSIFKVKPGASELEINSAYKRLALKETPRTVQEIANRSKSNAAKIINDARNILLNEAKTKLATPLLESSIPMRAGEPPVVNRSELTGRQLGMTNEQLMNPKAIKPNEDLGIAQRDFQLNKPVKPIQQQNITEKAYNFEEDMKKEIRNPDGVYNNVPVKQKVNFIDYVRTPDRVLEKIGLAKEAKMLRTSWEKYQTELPQEIQKITDWSKQVARPEGNQLIFKYLDGQINEKALLPNELKVATEIKDYLKDWARKLELPEDKRITSYITHIWANDVKGTEFPDEIASLIRDNVAGSVYDPFVTQRMGKQGYLEDTWRSLDAYVKRATRKYNMDTPLSLVKRKSETFEDSQFQYIKTYIDRVNMRPTELDTLIDNWIKSTPIGYKLTNRPVTNITQKTRQMVYRGLLGLNPATALKNLSQGANTYAELGEKYTIIGYANVVRDLPSYLTGKPTELEQSGVLKNGFIEDRTLNATRKFWEKADSVLFYMFNIAEKINRGAAFYGAKARTLNQGKTYAEAIEAGKELVRKTQFEFGAINTPVALQGDLVKTFTQFTSYTTKQIEFLGEKIHKKEFAGIIRYIASSLLFVYTIGKAFGMKWSDIIPTLRLGVPPTMQAGLGAYEVLTGQSDKWGNEADPNLITRALENKNLTKGITAYIPGGNQIFNKTIPGVQSYIQGRSTTASGKTKYEVKKTPSNLINSAFFGQYSTPEGQEYINNLGKSKGQITYEKYKALKGRDPEKAKQNMLILQKYDSDLYKSVLRARLDEEMKISSQEKSIRSLPIDDRVNSIAKNLKKYPAGSQKRQDLMNRYYQLGILTKSVYSKLYQMKSKGQL